MMDRVDNPSAVTCTLCGEAYTLPEEDVDGNLPRVLLCAHIYCTSCLLSIQCDGVIRCPECEVESNLPEGGVFGLQEDSRIIGLIYTSKMNKMKRCERFKNRKRNKLSPSTDNNADTKQVEQPADIKDIEKAVDEALVQAAENYALLDHIHESLMTGLAEKLKRERTGLEIEIKQAADKALHAIQKWGNEQLQKLEEQFSTSQAQVCCVQERMKALDIAMKMAREVRRVPFLEQYCSLDKVLETLHSPVDNQSFDMKRITMDFGMSCVFLSECENQSLSLSLKMEVSNPKNLSESPPIDVRDGFNRKSPRQRAKGSNKNCILPSCNKFPTPQTQDQKSPGANTVSSPSPTPRYRPNLSSHNSSSDHETPDVIVEELVIHEQENALPPTSPELANDKWRGPKRIKNLMLSNKRNGTQWVVVTHIVNPNHFYVRYLAEKKDSEILSKKIQSLCNERSSYFTSSHTVETGSMIFAKCKEERWCRASVAEVLRKGCVEAVKACPATQLASIRVFFLDYGYCKIITILSEEGNTESTLKAVNNCLRKVHEWVNVELQHFVPQAIRCSLKDLIPYDLTKGWSNEAQVEFQSVVGSAAVEMRPLGQDRDSLLVDLRKVSMDQSSALPISVREFLVFIEVARFYSPVKLGRRPLLYYPRDYPKFNTELNAVVSHINNPSDFYIQLVDNMESLLLSTKLQECYNATRVAGEDDLNIYCPVIKQACVARYGDKLWYRAQVIGHPGGRKVEVQYVDFGNKDILSVSDLRKIKDEFFALPSMAIHCSLSDVIPLDGKTWSDACCNRFVSLAHQKPVTVVAIGRAPKTEPLPVKLFESGLNGPLANIAGLLVTEELASFKEGLESKDNRLPGDESAIWDPPLELGNTCGVDDPDQKQTEKLCEEPLEVQCYLKLSDQLKDLKVTVSHVNSPSSFYVQLSQYNSQLKRMCELVKESAQMEPQDVVWKADMSCAAHINGVWERGRICADVTSSNIVEVMRCDHGNMVKLDVSCLRPLPLSLKGSLALECTLTDIRPAGGRSTWTATACDMFSNYLTGASAVMTIKELTDERPVPVTLFCPNRMGQLVSIADFLASEGLALKERKPRDAVIQKSKETDPKSAVSETKTDCSDGENKNTPPAPLTSSPSSSSLNFTPTVPIPTPRTIMSAQKVQTQLYQPPELPCLSHIKITVTAIGEDGVIYTRTQNAEYQLDLLQERIQQSMKTLPKQKPYTWKSVLGCSVIGPDMLWYRGQLLEVLGGHVKVQYVDYGLVESIPVVHVYPRLLCDDIPQLCMPCQLHSINPVGGKWQRDAVALLREVLLNRSVDMQVMELPADPRGPLKVELFLDRLSLSRILCHHEHASIDRTVSAQEHAAMSPALLLDDWDINTEGLEDPEEQMLGPFIQPNLPQEEQFQVRVKHLWTPNELFLWPLEGEADLEVDGETLEKALDRINAKRYGLQRLTNFCHGSPCLAEYSDGKYYRAKLIKFTSIEPLLLLVQHVDFGSDDTLPTSKLRRMPAELLRFPSQALKVKVAGFKAPIVNKHEKVLPYSPGWSVKAAMDMIDMLHGHITASVVARDPELKVLLYNEKQELVHLPLVSSGLAELE
ncbi:RING finger protein 17 [Etheostoma spectabile]|uniref:RING finger protein 17 n=1 Tax=Etheostoma spectabile TaxID=54343 RepID=UPI0013AEF5D0|nr:RING finger protein 17 [Etheostoma spectabile]